MVGRMFDAMSEGRFAVGSIVDSYAKIAAGCLLIVPGFITDALGLALLVPPLRSLMLRRHAAGHCRPAPRRNTQASPRDRPSRRARSSSRAPTSASTTTAIPRPKPRSGRLDIVAAGAAC